MKIAFNPSTVAALTTPPNNKDITFDLRGQNIFARGVKFCGTDTNTWRDIKINNVSIGSNILDLRNGSNTTLTSTNGVVTINSTWRPVVDNLTSNSTTSSLSANQGRILKALIDSKVDSDHNHDDRYVRKSGDTMLGALNFANGTWNLVGDDSYMGDCNVSGHFGIKAANTTYPGIAFFNNASTFLGNLTAYSGNIKYGAYSLQFLDNGNTRVSASTWTNPFNNYNSNAVADGQAICVWGQSSYLGNLANDTGNMSLWLRRVNANVATLNMVLDGEYYANGNQRLAHVSEIPTSLKNPHALTISLNGTSQGPYDGSAAKNINITPGSIGAATSGHNHDGRYVRYYAVTTLDCNNLAAGLTAARISATNAAHTNPSAYLYISDVGTPFQIQIPDSSVPYIYKRYYDSGSGTWGKWFKLNAGYADSAGSVAWNNITGKPSSYIPSAHTHSWTSITDKVVAGNEFNIVNAGVIADLWFNYLPINDRGSTATISNYRFGNGHRGLATVQASGFIKAGSSSSYVLLGDGGHKAVSDFATASSLNNYVTLTTSQTISGVKTFSTQQKFTVGSGTAPFAVSSNTLVTNLNADLLDGYHAASFVKIYAGRFTQYNQGTWTKILQFTIPSGNLQPTISFIWHPTECVREVWADFNINIRSGSPIFYVNWKGTTRRTVYCVGDGTTYSVWVSGTKSNYDPYGLVQVISTLQINTYQAGSLQYSDSEPTGTYKVAASMTGIILYADRLLTARKINGTSFNGTANIVTSYWGTTRTLTIGNSGKSVNGSANISWSLSEIGAADVNHTHGLLHSDLTVTLANTTTDSGWSMINSSYNGFLLKSIRTQGSAPNWIENNCAAGICFGGADTKGVVSVAYFTPYIKFAGGNGSKPVWWIRLSGTSGATYNLANFNADTVDGYHANGLLTALSNSNNGISITVGGTTKSVSNISVNYASSAGNAGTLGGMPKNYGQAPFNTIPYIGSDGGMEIGRYIDFHNDNSGSYDYSTRLQSTGNYGNTVSLPSASGTLALTSDIPTVTNYYWANVKISTSSNTQTRPSVNTIYANNWFRSQGTSGWYNESYGGGIWMNDNNWIRTYGGRSFYCDNQIYSSYSIRMGDIYLQSGNEINSASGLYLNYKNSSNVVLCQGGGNVGIGYSPQSYKLDVNGQMRAGGFHHGSVNSDNYILLAGGGYKSFGGDASTPIFLGYLNLDHGNDGTVSSSFYCLGYSVPFTYTRGGNYCRISIPDTTRLTFYINAAIASVNYSGGGMDSWVGVHRSSGAWWLHCYASGWNEVRVKGFRQSNQNNDSWWGGNPLFSNSGGANRITVCIFGYVRCK